jgi:hypothetical protein
MASIAPNSQALCFGVITLVASFTMRLGVVLADAAFTCPYEQDTELGRRDCALANAVP